MQLAMSHLNAISLNMLTSNNIYNYPFNHALNIQFKWYYFPLNSFYSW